MGKKIDEGMVQVIFVLLLVVALGVLGGWFLSIETTLALSFVSIVLIVCYILDRRNGGGSGGSGELGVFFMIMVPLAIFTIVLLVSGTICHWSDLLYLLREVFG